MGNTHGSQKPTSKSRGIGSHRISEKSPAAGSKSSWHAKKTTNGSGPTGR